MLLYPGRFRFLAPIIAICVVLGASLLVPATNATSVTVKLTVSRGPQVNYLNFIPTFPLTVGFSVNNSAPLSTYFWQFGDGSNSSNPAPTHVYDTPCVYNVQVQMTTSAGSVLSGNVVIGAFGASGQSGRALAVCPPQGTEGFISVELAGGFFPANKQVNVLMNGTSIATVTADSGGDWVLDVTGFLTPGPNGTQYPFTTSPPSLTRSFTTLEGVRGIPGSGAPGTNVAVEGRSYPSYSTITVYLGGGLLGTAQTDGSGFFLTSFQIPWASPFTQAGTYPYATLPWPVLGSHDNFTSAGALVALFSSWWWWLLLIIFFLVAAYLVRRWMRRRAVLSAQGQGQPTS